MGITANHIKSGLKTLLYYGADGLVYRLHALLPVAEHRALFVEMTEPNATHDFALMMDHLRDKGFMCDFVSLQRGRVPGVRYIANCICMSWKAARVRLLFLCDASMPVGCLPVRRQTKVVQLWHGCGAFKKFGLSTASKSFGPSLEESLRFPHYGNVSLVTVSSPEVVWAYEEAMGFADNPGVVQALGVSRTDAYFRKDQLTAWRTQAVRAVPQIARKKVLLYAPTFRGQVTDPVAPEFLDVERMRELLGGGWVLLVKHHPFVRDRPAIPAPCRYFAFDVTEDLSIEEAMAVADVCVTDYSSLVFEWSLLNKPIAFLAPDRKEYDDGRGFYYGFCELVPGPVLESTDDLAKWAAHAEDQFDYEALARFKEKFMGACDGHATERIASVACTPM